MTHNFDFSPLEQKLSNSNRILIVLPKQPNIDTVASALALFLSLKKTDKNILIGCDTKMQVKYNRLFGVDKIQQKIGNRNLVISFDYKKEAIEKVSYNVDNGKFNLVVEPHSGNEPLDADSVSYSYSGADADIVIVVGATELSDLGEIYTENKDLFAEAHVVNINNQRSAEFGKQNYLVEGASKAEVIISLIKKLNLPVDQDIATNLMTALEYQTQGFQKDVAADTFEAAAWCLKIGGKRGQLKVNQQKRKKVVEKKVITAKEEQKEGSAPPPDWLKPKIYKADEKLEEQQK
jgi:nanoRNase/pAp phosphatase (c-di-AMP/oligoRNAs hydrolase)